MPEGEKENQAGHGFVRMYFEVKSPDEFLKNPAQAKEAATEFSKSSPCSHPFYPKWPISQKNKAKLFEPVTDRWPHHGLIPQSQEKNHPPVTRKDTIP
jgi:hypothetical protein